LIIDAASKQYKRHTGGNGIPWRPKHVICWLAAGFRVEPRTTIPGIFRSTNKASIYVIFTPVYATGSPYSGS
jgi:hypothetical protein